MLDSGSEGHLLFPAGSISPCCSRCHGQGRKGDLSVSLPVKDFSILDTQFLKSWLEDTSVLLLEAIVSHSFLNLFFSTSNNAIVLNTNLEENSIIVARNVHNGCVNVGPSGVRALPLAAGRNVGGHYKWHFFSFFLSSSLLILPEGVVIGFRNFA